MLNSSEQKPKRKRISTSHSTPVATSNEQKIADGTVSNSKPNKEKKKEVILPPEQNLKTETDKQVSSLKTPKVAPNKTKKEASPPPPTVIDISTSEKEIKTADSPEEKKPKAKRKYKRSTDISEEKKQKSLEIINSTLLDDETFFLADDIVEDTPLHDIEPRKEVLPEIIQEKEEEVLTKDELDVMEKASAEKAPSIFEEQWNIVANAVFDG